MSEIIGIFGLQGWGKTMLLTTIGKMNFDNGEKIYSNYHLKNISYEPIINLNDIDKMRKGSFLGDELWLWIFARCSMTKINQEFAKIIMLNRKRGINIYYTAQLKRQVDVLLKEVSNYRMFPRIKTFTYKENGIKKETKRLTYITKDLLDNEGPEVIVNNSLDYLGSLYDTYEEIGNLNKEKNNISFEELGKELENDFKISLKKLGNFCIMPIPHSGNKQDLPFDFIVIKDNKNYVIDVKSITLDKGSIRIINVSKNISEKIKIAKKFNFIPLWAFPKGKGIISKNPKNWYLMELNKEKNKNYLKNVKFYPYAGKLEFIDLIRFFA